MMPMLRIYRCDVYSQLSSMWLKDEFQEHIIALNNEVSSHTHFCISTKMCMSVMHLCLLHVIFNLTLCGIVTVYGN